MLYMRTLATQSTPAAVTFYGGGRLLPVNTALKVALPDPTRLNLLPYAYGFFPLLLAWLTDSARAR